MATPSYLQGNVHVAGAFSCTSMQIPAGTVQASDVAAAAGIEATKLEHQHAIHYWQADGTAIAAAIVPVHTVRGTTATIIGIDVVCVDAPSGGDLAFSVDLLVADVVAPTPATVLSAPVAYSETQTDCEVESGTIASATLADGDTLLVQVAVTGSTGTQGQGLIVTVTVREDAD